MSARRRFVLRIAMLGATAFGVSLFATATHAQPGAVPRSTVQAEPSLFAWSFSTPIPQDSFKVRGVTQWAIPISVFVPIGRRWAFDASGAYASGHVAITAPNNTQHDISLDGPTDIKARLVGRLGGDRWRLTLGVNVPSGATGLSGTQINAVRVLGAPALRTPVPVLGSGLGATAGAVMAVSQGEWAFAFGTSYEVRGSYAPIEASIAGVSVATDLDPADALHFTVGADRLLGAHRVSFLVGADVYGEDRLSINARQGAIALDGHYKLGPGITALSVIDLGVRGFRECTLSLVERYRSSFTGTDGKTAAGSAGNFLDANVRAISGAPERLGWIFGADAHFDSGQEVDNSIATAAVTSVGVTLGVSVPAGRSALQPFVRAQFGSLDAGLASTSMKGYSVGLTLTGR